MILMALAILVTTAAVAQQKVVIISSSPRHGGNTDLLCDEFRRGAEEAGATVEKISLSDYRIDFINAKANVKGMVKATGIREKGDVKGSKFMREAYELGKNISKK